MDREIDIILKNKNSYRRSEPKDRAKLEKAQKLMQQGIEGEKDILSKVSTTMAKAARDEQKMAEKEYYSVPEKVREYEAYNAAGYKSGGLVSVRGQGAARKTKGCKIC